MSGIFCSLVVGFAQIFVLQLLPATNEEGRLKPEALPTGPIVHIILHGAFYMTDSLYISLINIEILKVDSTRKIRKVMRNCS